MDGENGADARRRLLFTSLGLAALLFLMLNPGDLDSGPPPSTPNPSVDPGDGLPPPSTDLGKITRSVRASAGPWLFAPSVVGGERFLGYWSAAPGYTKGAAYPYVGDNVSVSYEISGGAPAPTPFLDRRSTGPNTPATNRAPATSNSASAIARRVHAGR